MQKSIWGICLCVSMAGASSVEDTIWRSAAVLVEILKKKKKKKKKRAEVGQREGLWGDAICKGALHHHGRRMGGATKGTQVR